MEGQQHWMFWCLESTTRFWHEFELPQRKVYERFGGSRHFWSGISFAAKPLR